MTKVVISMEELTISPPEKGYEFLVLSSTCFHVADNQFGP